MINDDDNFDGSVGDDTLELSNVLDETEVTENLSDDDALRLSSLSTVGSFHNNKPTLISTPTKAKRKRQRLFKVPDVPPIYFKKCPTCKRGLKTEKGYNNHVLAHKWKEAAKQRVSLDKLFNYTLEKSKQVVDDLLSKESVKSLAAQVIPHLGSKEWMEFVKKLFEIAEDALEVTVTYGITFPSTLRAVFQEYFSEFVSSESWRNEALDKLKVVVRASDVKWIFVFEMIKQLLDGILTFVFREMNVNPSEQCTPYAKDDHSHHITQQVIHHVAGAAIRGCVRHCRKYPKNKRLKRREDCLLSKFTHFGSPLVLNERDPKYWTSLLNRGSLFFMYDNALPFFLQLCEFLMSCETACGTIGHEKVMEKLIAQKTVLHLWDSIVQDTLNEDESFSLMVKVIRAIYNTYGKGIMMRRMNKATKTTKANKGTISISRRARLI